MSKFLEIETPWVGCHRNMIADPDGKGIVQVQIPAEQTDVCYIWCLFVKEEHRKQGLATELLARAEEYGRSKGCTKAVLDWNEADSPLWVFRWYEKNGYSENEFGPHVARLEKSLISKSKKV